ncbi:MAG: hypothetical protein HQL22_06405 [Candidatus Omnitrophica bacterium]|nr:hypothetical protein [Candidatus Omnitrophota bacterium]
MKKMLSVLLAGVLMLTVSGAVMAQEAGYVASKGGTKYHFATCSIGKKITADKLVKFAAPEDAVKAGYTPCKTCNPPPTSDAFVATKSGGKYHKQGCKMLGNTDADNKVYFKDAAAAEKAGYKPCGVCLKRDASK